MSPDSWELVDRPSMPSRDPLGHKGTFGTVGVIGGQCGDELMVGGPAFSAQAALRSGCGLAMLVAPRPILPAILEVVPEATGLPIEVRDDGTLDASGAARVIDEGLARATVIAIGPGFGQGESQRQILIRLVAREDHPLVIDADALNLLARTTDLQADLRAPSILTPHPGEFARLAGSLGIDPNPGSSEERIDAARQLAARLGVVVVLKGPGTVVSDGIRVYVNPTGNPGLATGGSGDVLTGLCAGFLSQFHTQRDLFECACMAVWVHGHAADLIASERGTPRLLARELLDAIPASIATYE
ncbi:MAG: NAD(P)H-hydrate dehydratase [Planctomycetota bacterium]|nr:NAD(P)H-hydrate dehydratase [Planctomycetota bacterium]